MYIEADGNGGEKKSGLPLHLLSISLKSIFVKLVFFSSSNIYNREIILFIRPIARKSIAAAAPSPINWLTLFIYFYIKCYYTRRRAQYNITMLPHY